MIVFHKADHSLLTKDLKELFIIPIGDTHLGDPSFVEKELKEQFYIGRYMPTLYLLMGDILNNATKSSVSNCYHEIIPAGDEQINYGTELLGEISNNTVGAVIGNHEYRTNKDVNVDVAMHLAENLHIPYFGTHGLVQIQFGKNKKGDPINYHIYMHHGSGGGGARSGTTTKMQKQDYMINGADIYLRGHSHLIDVFPTTINQFDARTHKVYKQNIYHISTGAWLDTTDYAEKMELPPLPIGCPTIRLNGEEKEISVKA